ncbi:hypothetical protein [Morganella morganii]|uniref:hypothetical protein n=1 Tax=Morganella morganii TaxID=582 RepID=UPI003EBBEC7D
MSNKHYDMTVFGIDYKLYARESGDAYLTFHLEDNSKFPPIDNSHANKLILNLKLYNGVNKKAVVARAPLGRFMMKFL